MPLALWLALAAGSLATAPDAAPISPAGSDAAPTDVVAREADAPDADAPDADASDADASDAAASDPAASDAAVSDADASDPAASNGRDDAVARDVAAPSDDAAASEPEASATSPGPKQPYSVDDKRVHERLRFPRLVIAGGPTIGPHAIGNQECRSEDRRCETAGGFFGVGLQVEARARLWQMLYAHARGQFAGNVAPKNKDPIYDGLWGLGIGFGAYGRRIFGRAEYLFVDTYGKSTFTPPFHTAPTGRDRWGHHAGLISVGFRQPFGRRLAVELWGGPMIGPKSVRTIPPTPPERRILPTFIIGINLAYDVVQ